MQTYDDFNGTQKRKKFRQQIRRKQINKLFRIQRYQLPTMTSQQASQKCKNNFSQIHNMLHHQYQNLYNNERLSLLIKQLRQINCIHIVPSIFTNKAYINILLQLQNSQSLNKTDYIFLYEIFLNITAELQQKQSKKKIKINNQQFSSNLYIFNNMLLQSLKISQNMQSNNAQIIVLTLQIMGNYLSKDETTQTVYYLITKVKIFLLLIKLLFENKQLLNKKEVCRNYYWFVNRLISCTYKYKQNKIDKDCQNLVKCIYKQLQNWLKQQKNSSDNSQQNLYINDILIYMKTLIRTGDIELSEQIIQDIQKYFSSNNTYYIDFLGTLTAYTLYTLPLFHLEELLQKLLSHPQDNLALNIIIIINNSLQNNNQNWKTVMDYFFKFANEKVPSNINFQKIHENNIQNYEKYTIDYSTYGMLSYFMYFLHNQKTQQVISKLIKILIIAQGGTGIFANDCHFLIQSAYMKKILYELGFQIQQVNQL